MDGAGNRHQAVVVTIGGQNLPARWNFTNASGFLLIASCLSRKSAVFCRLFLVLETASLGLTPSLFATE